MRRKSVQFAALLTAPAMLAAGCLDPKREHYQSAVELSFPERTPQADRLWEAVQETLREHRFRLDRVDRVDGVITTFPLGSEHFFEIWRHDVDTRRDYMEATLNPMRRRVEVHVTVGENGDWQGLSFAVYKQRLSAPDRQFNSSAAAYQFFSTSLPTTTGERPGGEPGEDWLEMGRDPAMEERLLQRTLSRARPDRAPAIGQES